MTWTKSNWFLSFCPDFREHPVGFLFESFFKLHDRAKVEVFAYAINPDNLGSEQREKIRRNVEHFHTVHSLNTEETLDKMIADGIDVVVNLAGKKQQNERIQSSFPVPMKHVC